MVGQQKLNHHFFARWRGICNTVVKKKRMKRRLKNSNCIFCDTETAGAHFCPECTRIQPLATGTDYFAFLGLEKRLQIGEAALEKLFYALSRQFHPDYFMNASEEERQASLDRSAMLNAAYRTLRDPVQRAKYLLTLEGYKESEKKAPPDLLEEVFELNMQIEELKAAKKMGDEDEISEARAALDETLSNLNDRLTDFDAKQTALFSEWDVAMDAGTLAENKKTILDRLSELMSHRSYIRSLVREIEEEI